MSNCVVCGSTFPEGEGQFGDICSHCGWEVDEVVDCSTVVAWWLDHEQCTWEEAEPVLRSCTCHLNGEVRHCGMSDANHETVREARARYAR